MKCKKIRGVAKDICTAEQKIAYNFAFAERINSNDGKRYGIDDIISDVRRRVENDEEFQGFNREAIMTAFLNGIEDYMKLDAYLARNYEEVGKMFPL